MENESIYQKINRLSNGKSLPYSFQDINNSGRYDIKMTLFGEDISVNLQERYAFELVKIIIHCLDTMQVLNDVKKYIEEKPLFSFSSKFCSRLNLYISESLIDKEKLYDFGFLLTTKSQVISEVKLGILILGSFYNEITENVLRKLGLHSEFTLYVLEASYNWERQNDFVFDLAQNTSGYGKSISTYFLKPITEKIKKWMLYYGTIDEVMPNITCALCLRKVDMIEFLLSEPITEKSFPAFSRLYAYAFEKNDVKAFTSSAALINSYIASAQAFAKSFMDFSALLAIYNNMHPSWIEENVTEFDNKNEDNNEETYNIDDKREYKWDNSMQHIIRGKCAEVLELKRWKYIILNEMRVPHSENSQIVSAIKYVGMKPQFDDFLSMLQRDIYDTDIFDFMIIYNSKLYITDIVEYINFAFPEEIFTEGLLDIKEEELDYRYEPDILLKYTLRAMRRCKVYDEIFYLKCISSRLPGCRSEAIYCLRCFKDNWSSKVRPALERAAICEPVRNVKKRILRLLGIKQDDEPKEQRYIDVQNEIVKPSADDIFLMRTKIAGAFFRDMNVIAGVIEKGDMLYLVREPENEYDPRAILVTTDDGYVLGYVPKRYNKMPASFMDSGQKLYGILQEINITKSELKIIIMMSRRKQVKYQEKIELRVIK